MTVTRGKQDDRHLKLSHDRKVSPRGWWQDSRQRWVPTVPNSFGLPAGTTCPGRTEFCVSCYGTTAERSKGVAALLDHNLTLLSEADTVDLMAHLLAEMVGRYRADAESKGLPAEDLLFRWHWDGDFFSEDYAHAAARVMRGYPDVRFWCYTRSFRPALNVVPILAPVPNLALYLSVDDENITDALDVLTAFPTVSAAFCAADYRTARGLAEKASRTAVPCPENNGRMALMEDGRGACVTCRICPDRRRDIMFATSHSEDAAEWRPVQLRRRRPTPPAPAAPDVTACEGPGCTVPIDHRQGKSGRRRLYHDEVCRENARRLRHGWALVDRDPPAPARHTSNTGMTEGDAAGRVWWFRDAALPAALRRSADLIEGLAEPVEVHVDQLAGTWTVTVVAETDAANLR